MRNRFLFCIYFFSCISVIAQKYNNYDAEGKRHGQWQKKFPNSDQIRYEGIFEHGKEVGEFKFYKPSGGSNPTAIKKFTSKSDTVVVQYFTQKGKVISEGKMINKDRIGLWKYYHNGSNKIMMTENYRLGKLHGEQLTYFENGKLTEKNAYAEGKREGQRIIYSEDGIIIKEFTYENDKLHGLTRYYDTKGVLIIEGNYKRNLKNGIWKYYENGKLKEQKKFPLVKSGTKN